MKNDLEQKIEAILFYTAETVETKKLAKILDVSEEKIEQALSGLSTNLEGRGVRLVRHEGTVLLVTASEYSNVLEKMIKEERESVLGRASLETLSIIAYKGPVSKKEIEYIRGVNSDYAIRSLLLRGLVEKKNSETDMRSTVYTITTDTLLHLGLSSQTDLPEYTSITQKLEGAQETLETDSEDTDNHGE